jgi:hypothetical protein
MDNGLFLISGAFLFLAAAIAPKASREKLKDFFQIGAGDSLQGQDSVDSGTGAFFSFSAPQSYDGATLPNNPAPKPINVHSLPWNRVLTEAEIRALASYVRQNYGFNASEKGLVTIAWIESSFRPWVERDEGFDKSTGLMQTLLGTAKDMYAKGYSHMGAPTHARLKNPLVSMYFGAAYVDWLKKNWPGRSSEWYARAYNGGPGWERTANGPTNTAKYYSKFVEASKRFSISVA